MSNIDKKALRINAQLASSGKWIKESGDGWEAICSSDDQANSGFIIAHFEGPDAKENREFIQAANPAAVLALLDELEAKDKQIAELSQKADIYDMLRQDYELHGSLVDFVDWQAKRIADYQELISALVGVSSSILREVERINKTAAAGKGEAS